MTKKPIPHPTKAMRRRITKANHHFKFKPKDIRLRRLLYLYNHNIKLWKQIEPYFHKSNCL